MNRSLSWLFAVAVLAIAPMHGFAQQQTTATYEDWTVRCAVSGKPPETFCDLEQLSQLKGNEKPFSRVLLSRAAKGEPLRLIIQVPVNVFLATGVRIQTGGKNADLTGPFTRCLPSGCFAAIPISDSVVAQFLKASAPARIVYTNGAQREVVVPLSFKGFDQAFKALTKG